MARGQDTGSHPNRSGTREARGYTNLVSGVTHSVNEEGWESVQQQPFVDPQGNPTPQHERAMERLDRSASEGYQDLSGRGQQRAGRMSDVTMRAGDRAPQEAYRAHMAERGS
jgi:hypothetical protein